MPTAETLQVIRINVGSIIIFLPRVFIHSWSSRSICAISHIPCDSKGITRHVISINRKDCPMPVMGCSTNASFQINMPVFKRLKNQTQLVRIKILLAILLTPHLHLLYSCFLHRIAVGIVSRLYRPTTWQIMKKMFCQISRACKIFTGPFVWQDYSEPVCHLTADLAV